MPQCSDGTDFIDSPWEAIPSLRRWGQARGRCGEPDKAKEGELQLICKIKKQTKNQSIKKKLMFSFSY